MNKPPDETLKQGRNRSWLLVKLVKFVKIFNYIPNNPLILTKNFLLMIKNPPCSIHGFLLVINIMFKMHWEFLISLKQD
jgi:hypothetical protein